MIKQFVRIDNALSGVARKVPLHPNLITLLSLVLSAVSAYFIYNGEISLGVVFVGLAFLCDGLDGVVARAQGKSTEFGAYLDGISDRIVESIVLVAMIDLPWPIKPFAVYSILTILIFGTFLTSFAKAYADHRKVIRDPHVLEKMWCVFERSERAILLFTSLLLYIYSPLYSQALLFLGALLSVIAFLQRFLFVFKHSGQNF